jgi:threonine dehydratase
MKLILEQVGALRSAAYRQMYHKNPFAQKNRHLLRCVSTDNFVLNKHNQLESGHTQNTDKHNELEAGHMQNTNKFNVTIS